MLLLQSDGGDVIMNVFHDVVFKGGGAMFENMLLRMHAKQKVGLSNWFTSVCLSFCLQTSAYDRGTT